MAITLMFLYTFLRYPYFSLTLFNHAREKKKKTLKQWSIEDLETRKSISVNSVNIENVSVFYRIKSNADTSSWLEDRATD